MEDLLTARMSLAAALAAGRNGCRKTGQKDLLPLDSYLNTDNLATFS
jgi:hypothetical protein